MSILSIYSDKEGEDNNEEQYEGDEDMDGKRGISYQVCFICVN
jgi:hypothetical protein